jgi:uncharacterized protein YqgC (DUF456 family)
MVKEIFRIARIIFGLILVLVGISGVILPVLPGWILIFVGIELLGIQLVCLDKIKAYVVRMIEEARKPKKK